VLAAAGGRVRENCRVMLRRKRYYTLDVVSTKPDLCANARAADAP
jgi:hypothetical protein